jgi:hypothetical protein
VLGINQDWRLPNTSTGESVSENTAQKPLEELSRGVRVERAIREISSWLRLLTTDYKFIVKLVRDSGLLELAELYENMKNCVEEYTYVYNKAKKKYYYYYLKCKDRKPASIYIGKSPEGYNQLRRAAFLAFQLKARVDAVVAALRELEEALVELRENTAILENALTKIKK